MGLEPTTFHSVRGRHTTRLLMLETHPVIMAMNPCGFKLHLPPVMQLCSQMDAPNSPFMVCTSTAPLLLLSISRYCSNTTILVLPHPSWIRVVQFGVIKAYGC